MNNGEPLGATNRVSQPSSSLSAPWPSRRAVHCQGRSEAERKRKRDEEREAFPGRLENSMGFILKGPRNCNLFWIIIYIYISRKDAEKIGNLEITCMIWCRQISSTYHPGNTVFFLGFNSSSRVEVDFTWFNRGANEVRFTCCPPQHPYYMVLFDRVSQDFAVNQWESPRSSLFQGHNFDGDGQCAGSEKGRPTWPNFQSHWGAMIFESGNTLVYIAITLW